MLLNFRRLQAHAFTNDQQHTASNAGVVHVAHASVAGTLDALGGLAVDHDGAGPHDFLDFSGGRAVLQVAAEESELLLDALHFGVGWLVGVDPQLPPDHVCDEHGQGLRGSTRCADGAGKVDGDKRRAVDVAQQTDLRDAFERGDQHGFGQDRQADAEAHVDALDHVVPVVTKGRSDPLGHQDGRRFTVVFRQHRTDVVGHRVTVKVLDEQLLGSAGQVGSARNFHVVSRIEALGTRRFCDGIGFLGPLVQPQVVPLHFCFQAGHVKPEQGVVVWGADCLGRRHTRTVRATVHQSNVVLGKVDAPTAWPWSHDGGRQPR